MSILDRTLRKKLSETIIAARQVAEEAARDAVRRLGVAEDEAPAYLTADQKTLRVRLRAHARTLGDEWNPERKKVLTTKQLENEAAYEIWHRMLFGRFLVERGLLIHPELEVPIAAGELADLAQEAGEPDPWALVERFAAPSLPAVFKPDDPVLAMTLDPALANRLRDLVAGLPVEVFTAEDSLGWTYQFWREAEKERVLESGAKIGASELPAVTQLFTEPYMVKFLLHNTLGAWWAAKVLGSDPALAREAADEQALRDACAVPGVEWDYLRFVRDGDAEQWRPAAGDFPGWPSNAGDITYCDPCCGSGHFLVETFTILSALRQQEEGLSREAAAKAVILHNVYGLELDGRCVQIAAFNVALAAWSFAGHPVVLPQPRIAWAGAPSPLSRSEMSALGGRDAELSTALGRLHDTFEQARSLGSLLEIKAQGLLDDDFYKRGASALEAVRATMCDEPELSEGVIAARGLLDATENLKKTYTLIATNVPFLGIAKCVEAIRDYVECEYGKMASDLYVAFLLRIRALREEGGTAAVVTPQNWYGLITVSPLRECILATDRVNLVCDLGPAAFNDMNWWAQRTALTVLSTGVVDLENSEVAAFDCEKGKGPELKARNCLETIPAVFKQKRYKAAPAHVFLMEHSEQRPPLGIYASCVQGISTGDNSRLVRSFFEMPSKTKHWRFFHGPPDGRNLFSGMNSVVDYKTLTDSHDFRPAMRGNVAWGRTGLIFGQMKDIPCSIYTGELFANSSPVMYARDKENLEAIYAFVESGEFREEVRRINRKNSVDNGYFTRVGFDFSHWKTVAKAEFPWGLPKPYSKNPGQWVFHGHPTFAEQGTQLHVALARLAGYRWPAEIDDSMSLSNEGREHAMLASKLSVDGDGYLPLMQTSTCRPLADRLRSLLACAYGVELSPVEEKNLVRQADIRLDKKESRNSTLEGWLRDRAFRQHCVLFGQRPFLWHIWDGLPDGFSTFVNYHKLDRSALERMAFTFLGDWIAKARAERRAAHEDRGLQLQQRLRGILEGEAPIDIFVRWKTLAEQPCGWSPDLNDGVRVNIRPFMLAKVLREQPRINWKKDGGSDLPSAPWYQLGPHYKGNRGDRINDHHLALAEKREAQRQVKAS